MEKMNSMVFFTRLFLCTLFCAVAVSVPADDHLRFEAASVKPLPRWVPGNPAVLPPLSYREGGPGSHAPTRVVLHAYSLQKLAVEAFGVKQLYQLSGPSWFKDTDPEVQTFDVVATLPNGATEEQFRAMLQELLVDRFHLKFRRENGDVPGYALVIGRKGHKLNETEASVEAAKPSEPGAALDPATLYQKLPPVDKDGFRAITGVQFHVRAGRTYVRCLRCAMAEVSRWLSANLQHPVIDQTGLIGSYDFDLNFQRVLRAGSMDQPDEVSPSGNSDVDLVGAIRSQLGLDLTRQKVRLETVVVEQVDRMPTAN
jgi:uncharacterized protein (TIGR03435 family)